MAIFTDCVVVLNVKELPVKERNKLNTAIKNNDGIIAYVVNQQCTHVITSDLNSLSSCRLKAIQKYNIPVVNLDYVPSCIKEGKLLDVSCYKPSEPTSRTPDHRDATEVQLNLETPHEELQDDAESFRFISTHDSNIPPFPQEFEVAKYSIMEKNENAAGAFVVVELQVSQKNDKFPYRISSHLEQSQQQQKQFIFTSIAEKAEEAYDWCIQKLVAQEFTVKSHDLAAAQHLASEKLQQLIIEEALNTSTISTEVGLLVEMVWAEALGHLEDQLINPTSISLNDVSKAEGILLQLKKAFNDIVEEKTLRDLMFQFYSTLLIRPETDFTVTKRKISEKQDLCQLLRDVINASEATSWTPIPSSLNKYHALRCQIEYVDPNVDEFLHVKTQLLNTNQSTTSVKILQIFRVARLSETKSFQSHFGNIQQLYHASAGSNFVGILSRGLLLPKMVVENHGVERTDIGNLGSGIYFSNSISTSIKYSKPSKTDGSRLLVICDVSLGKCKEYYKKDFTLSAPPPEYSSVHGIRKTESIYSEFEDDEFVVYSTSQVKMRYVVQFCIGEDQLEPFHPLINVNPEEISPSTLTSADIDIDDLETAQDPSKSITPGLQDSAGNVIPLQEIHVEAKLMDLVAEVVVFQSYVNTNTFPIEAKYVFPLDDTAAVCGFEAFINKKHIIGQVKEKSQAHREYRQAIRKGHGAYLMDQAAADVFTISVGNLPSNASVIIKITYITELAVDREYISFRLSGSLTSQQRNKALQEKTQESLKNIDVQKLEPAGGFSLNLSIEMPYEIKEITSPTHSIKIKRTDCKAVVSMDQNSCLGTGFQLLILLAEIHTPRMWVENNPEKDSQACMLAFYPEFDVGTLSNCEVIICLDCSYSMRGLVLDEAKKVALLLLRYLPTNCKFNVITFGTDYKELFHCSQQRNSEDAVKVANNFILSVQKPMGNTDFWRPLLNLNLLAPSKRIRNVLLISDGHLQNETLTLKIVCQNVKHTRIFTCGVGSTANRHMLRMLAQYGGGALEMFDWKTKFSWKAKVLSQVDRVTQPGCSSIFVKWERFSCNAAAPVQAPAQIHSVFSNSRLLIYGFVPHCTKAELSAVINDQEICTMVSTTELQKTKGKILHRLTAKALIGDYEHGNLDTNESEHEMKKSTLKSYIIELSKEYSILTQFTSFLAIEERYEQEEDLSFGPSIQELAAKESVDILPYMDWEKQLIMGASRKYKQEEDLPSGPSIPELTVKESVDILPYMDWENQLKMGASRKELLQKWEVPKKSFSKESNGDYAETCYNAKQIDSLAPTKYFLTKSASLTPFEKSNRRCRQAVIHSERKASLHNVFNTSVKLATKEKTNDQSSKYSSSAEKLSCSSAAMKLSLEDGPVFQGFESTTHFNSGFLATGASDIKMTSFDASFPSFATVSDGNQSFFGLDSSVGASPSFGGPDFLAATVSSDVSSQVNDPPGLIAEDHSDYPRRKQKWCSSISPLFSFSPSEALRSTYSIDSAITNGVPFSFSSMLQISPAISSEVFESALSKTSQDQNMVNQNTPQSLSKDTRDSHISPTSSNFKKLDKPRTAFGHLKQVRIHKLKKGSEEVLEIKNLKLKQGTQEDSKKQTERMVGSFQRKKKATQSVLRSRNCEIPWVELFMWQNKRGYWNFTSDLGVLFEIKLEYLTDVFLVERGIKSLGHRAAEEIVSLIATLMILQLIRFTEQLKGIKFKSLLCLDQTLDSGSTCWATEHVKKAITWARKTDRQHPAICSRLELGRDWESATRQLLQIDPLKKDSPLQQLFN
ncbi:protein mono-ADP-ribosyltransferase PARP4 isoform X2 [Hemiscyllium ocellatum]|uniref:protein mono-ADP-ribosyltransferase PARP4 isoform X2 n=1 Tax=Hemiscyllium ocellatum TaxID=170820 RepID=UPI002965FC1E|nr:protein mono-ADP-ribosyltransferase PARP4 isoform X2 [Hemiscyllium ocellatum]